MGFEYYASRRSLESPAAKACVACCRYSPAAAPRRPRDKASKATKVSGSAKKQLLTACIEPIKVTFRLYIYASSK